MLPGNGGIPFRTTDLGFCSDSSEVIFTFSLLAPVSHHHREAYHSCEITHVESYGKYVVRGGQRMHELRPVTGRSFF